MMLIHCSSVQESGVYVLPSPFVHVSTSSNKTNHATLTKPLP
jgi:hypothetical protein